MKRFLWVAPLIAACAMAPLGQRAWGQQGRQPPALAVSTQEIEIRFSRIDGRPQTFIFSGEKFLRHDV